MTSLVSKYEYLEKFNHKCWYSEEQKPWHRGYVTFQTSSKGDREGGPRKKQKYSQKPRE